MDDWTTNPSWPEDGLGTSPGSSFGGSDGVTTWEGVSSCGSEVLGLSDEDGISASDGESHSETEEEIQRCISESMAEAGFGRPAATAGEDSAMVDGLCRRIRQVLAMREARHGRSISQYWRNPQRRQLSIPRAAALRLRSEQNSQVGDESGRGDEEWTDSVREIPTSMQDTERLGLLQGPDHVQFGAGSEDPFDGQMECDGAEASSSSMDLDV